MANLTRLRELQTELAPYRQALIDHRVYAKVDSVEKLGLFMQSHVYAVWDFMSLLKYLQIHLTCVRVPWVPVKNTQICYLINEIVIDKESDVDNEGGRVSHFELYLRAMQRAGAASDQITKFVDEVAKNPEQPVPETLSKTNAREEVVKFLNSTFSFLASDKLHIAAAVFTFGREDLIPSMFISFVRQLHKDDPERFATFKYYLERHIEVDGDHHSHLAHEMTALLCGDDETKWQEATVACKRALQARVDLWDGIANRLDQASRPAISTCEKESFSASSNISYQEGQAVGAGSATSKQADA